MIPALDKIALQVGVKPCQQRLGWEMLTGVIACHDCAQIYADESGGLLRSATAARRH